MSNEEQKPKTKTLEEIAEAYSSPPWWYDIRGFFILTFAYNSTLWSQIRFFSRNIGQEHLEVAIGTASLFDMFLKYRRWKKLPEQNIYGIDYAEEMLGGAIKLYQGRDNIELKLADVADLPYEDNKFDTANIANAVHCFPDVKGGFRDVLRVLKPGGTLAANVLLYPSDSWPFGKIAQKINTWGIKKGILTTPYHQEEIREIMENAGFEITNEDVSGNCYNVIARKPQGASD